MNTRPLAWLLPVLLSGCEQSNELQLAFTPIRSNPELVSGFHCRTETASAADPRPSRLMVERAVTLMPRGQVEVQMSLVVDFIRIGSLPHCRLLDVFNHCVDEECAPISGARQCIPYGPELLPVEGLNARAVLEQAFAGQPITADAPDEHVIIRVVGSAEPCEDILARDDLSFEGSSLLGCAYSCPLVPDTVSGEVDLQLDTFAQECEAQVVACADPSFGGNLVQMLTDLGLLD